MNIALFIRKRWLRTDGPGAIEIDPPRLRSMRWRACCQFTAPDRLQLDKSYRQPPDATIYGDEGSGDWSKRNLPSHDGCQMIGQALG